MAEFPAWAVSAAILLSRREPTAIEALAADVVKTGLSGLGVKLVFYSKPIDCACDSSFFQVFLHVQLLAGRNHSATFVMSVL
jgi:hypothetical protein